MRNSFTRAGQCLLILAGSAMAVAAATAHGQTAPTDVWMVRTYRIGSVAPCPVETDRFDYLRLDARGMWTRRSRAEFFAAEAPPRPTAVFVHGGFTDDAWAVRLGMGLAGVLRSRDGGRPLRVVLWKWPSERSLRRIRPALQISIARADFEGQLLARWLRQFDAETPPTLIGWSAGCRVVAGALSRMAAESAAADTPGGDHVRFRAALVGAAIDADGLLPGRRYGLALDAAETMVVARHQGDRILRLYPRLDPGPGPQAMGLVGVAGPGLLGQRGERLEMMDLTACLVGRHDFVHYLSASPLAARLASLVFAESNGAEPPLPIAEGPVLGAR